MSKVDRRNEDLLRLIEMRAELYYPHENAKRAEEAINIAIKYIKKCQAQADEITALINKNKGVV